jgi:hypothetical protein
MLGLTIATPSPQMNPEFGNTRLGAGAAGTTNGHALFRKPVRITITINHAIYSALESRSSEQGRSISNLAAFLLEASLQGSLTPQKPSSWLANSIDK